MFQKSIIRETVAVLNQGGLILYPTDTVWGIGCDATNEKAVQRIFDLKQRPSTKSMILLIESPDKIQPYVSDLTSRMRCLLTENRIPQTVILPNASGLPHSLVASTQSIAVRCPKQTFCLQLLKAFGKPLVSTSANLSGQPTAALYTDISPLLLKGVDFIVPKRYEKGATKQPSRIIKIESDGSITVLRP